MTLSGSGTIRQVLRDRGPLKREAVIAAVNEQGLAFTDEDFEELWFTDGALPLVSELPGVGGELVATDALLLGRVFTHRLTAGEIEHDLLHYEPDLKPLHVLFGDDEAQDEPMAGLAGHGALTVEFDGPGVDPDGSLQLPERTLAGYLPGELLGVRATESGLVIEKPVSATGPPEILRTAFLDVLGGDPEMLDIVVWKLIVDHPRLFAEPTAPLSDLLELGDYVGPPGVDIGQLTVEDDLRRLQDTYGLDEDAALAVAALSAPLRVLAQALDRLDTDSDFEVDPVGAQPALDPVPDIVDPVPDIVDPAVAASLRLLADAGVAEALFTEVVGIEVAPAVVMGAAADSWLAGASHKLQPALYWLRGSSYQRLGDILAAEADFERAVGIDPAFEPALHDLASIASVRGDATRAVSLLKRAGVPADDEQLQMLAGYIDAGERKDLARNAPCWCGSGRKYKLCHRGKETVPLAARAKWLYQKAALFAQEGEFRPLIMDLADIRRQHRTADMSMWMAITDPVVTDATLFEGGALEAFLRQRGMLLPPDEQLLAAQWETVERSVFEVEKVRSGQGFDLRDVRTGEFHSVVERVGSRQATKGMLLSVRLLPVDEAVSIFGGIEPVPLQQLDETLKVLDAQRTGELTAQDSIEILSRRFAPPALVTGDGEPLVLCRTTLSFDMDEVDDIDLALEVLLEPVAPDVWHWLEYDEEDFAGSRILGVLRREPSDQGRFWVTIETMNERRKEELINLLADVVGPVTIEDESRTPGAAAVQAAIAAARQESDADRSAPTKTNVLADNPELASHISASFEKRWLSEHIPALGGLTPVEAAADPTRRGELIRLLASFPETDQPGMMSPARLRVALRLPPG